MSHVVAPAFVHSSGPRDAKIALIGEAHGEQEERTGMPFVGSSGQELTRMLRDANIEREQCFLTNVLAFRPPNNNLDLLCASRSEVGKEYPHAHLSQGKYLRAEYLGELTRLAAEMCEVRPNLIICLGNTACWAVLGSGRISSIRGNTSQGMGPFASNKILATYHPAAVMRQWSLRPIVLADFMKAKREAEFPDIRRPQRHVIVSPTLDEIGRALAAARGADLLAVDIETSRGQITHVGFAWTPSEAICIPFTDSKQANRCYWPTPGDELAAWKLVQAFLSLATPKVFQNGVYDLGFFIRWGFRVASCREDTMLKHHAMFPELQKGLGFLGSIYTSEQSWKIMRSRGATSEKADDE